MHFLSDAIAEIEGLLEVNRDFCKKQMAEKASPALPTNCAVLPLRNQNERMRKKHPLAFPRRDGSIYGSVGCTVLTACASSASVLS